MTPPDESDEAALQARVEALEKACAAVEAQCEEAQAVLAATHSRYEQLHEDLLEARREASAAHRVFESIGPTSLALAQRLHKLSTRFPTGGRVVKAPLRSAVPLRDRVRVRFSRS